MEVKIYVLYDPTTSTVRYIGRTKTSLNKRLSGHIYRATKVRSNSHKDNWIRDLLKNGIRPGIRLWKTLHNTTWLQSHIEEKKLIQRHFKKHNLVNGDDRGPGYTGAKNVTKEQEAIRIEKIKKFFSEDKNKSAFYNVIHCYDCNGKFYKSYKSTSFASKDLNIPIRKISNHRNKRDNYNAQVNSVEGFNFSKFKLESIPVYTKANRNVKSVLVTNKSTNTSKFFSTFKEFISYYKMSDWDSRNYVNGILTQKMKNFLNNYTIKSL